MSGGVVRFSEAASIALHTMAYLAREPARNVAVGELAARLAVSDHHLAKVMQRLVRAGLVESSRGPGGGFVLRGDPAEITMLQVYEAIEGRFDVEACLFSPAKCTGNCVLGNAPHEANALLHKQLAGTRLRDVVHVFAPGSELARLAEESGGRRRKRIVRWS
jgi:Rrf2 family protein